MNFLKELQILDDKQLEKRVREKIKRLERKSRIDSPGVKVLGYDIGFKPEKHELNENDTEKNFKLEVQCFYNSFIPKDMKVVFGISYDTEGTVYNKGKYYYVDDQEVLIDFCKWARDLEIDNEYELFGYIRDFLKIYFGSIPQVDRYTMFGVIHDENEIPYDPVIEHSMRAFKGKGNAMCTEYAILAQNILRLLGFESFLVIGSESFSSQKSGTYHAFNMVTFQESDTKDIKHAVVDFTIPVNVFDIEFRKIGEEPFFGFLDHIDQQVVDEIIYGGRRLSFGNYAYVLVGDVPVKTTYYQTREYFVDNVVLPTKYVK